MRRQHSFSLLWTYPEVENLGENNLWNAGELSCLDCVFGSSRKNETYKIFWSPDENIHHLHEIRWTNEHYLSSLTVTRLSINLFICHSCSCPAGINSETSLSSCFLNTKMMPTSLKYLPWHKGGVVSHWKSPFGYSLQVALLEPTRR